MVPQPPSIQHDLLSNRELLAVIRAWVNSNYPGCRLDYVVIHSRDFPVSVRLVDTPSAAAFEAAKARVRQDEEDGAPGEQGEKKNHGLSPVILDILSILREVKKPLTTTRLLEELAKRGKEWSERSVSGYLAKLVEDGTLSNPKGAKPAGYRLAEDETA